MSDWHITKIETVDQQGLFGLEMSGWSEKLGRGHVVADQIFSRNASQEEWRLAVDACINGLDSWFSHQISKLEKAA